MYDSPPPVPRSINVYAELARQYARPALALSVVVLVGWYLVANWQAHRETQEKIAALSAALAAKPADPAPQPAAALAPQFATAPAPESPASVHQAAFAEPKLLPPIQTAPPFQPAVIPAGANVPREPDKFAPLVRGIGTTDVLVIEAALRDPRTNQTDRIPLQLGGNEFAVRPDGTVSIGGWGTVIVAGLAPEKAADAVRQKLAAFTQAKGADAAGHFVVTVEVKAQTAAHTGTPIAPEVKPSPVVGGKACYVILDGGVNGEQVIKVPYNGTETVVDAIAHVPGLANDAAKRTIYLLRKGPAGTAQQALPVDWAAITQRGDTKTNYPLQPDDRVYLGTAR